MWHLWIRSVHNRPVHNFSLFTDSAEKYDSRDVQKLETDDALVEGYLTWRLYVVDDALKMIDESLHWRKEMGLNGKRSRLVS